MDTIQNGKGDSPRNLGKKFRDNYDDIDWGGWDKPNHPCHRLYDTLGLTSSKQVIDILVTYTPDELLKLTVEALGKDYEIRRKSLLDEKNKGS